MDGTAPSGELVLRDTGEVVDLGDPAQCAYALRHLRDLSSELKLAESALKDALVLHSGIIGKKTLHLPSAQVVVKGDTETLYDAEAIERDLLDAGMPSQYVADIVVEVVTTTRKVNAQQAKQAAAANPVYAEIIKRHSTVVAKNPTVTVK